MPDKKNPTKDRTAASNLEVTPVTPHHGGSTDRKNKKTPEIGITQSEASTIPVGAFIFEGSINIWKYSATSWKTRLSSSRYW